MGPVKFETLDLAFNVLVTLCIKP